MRCEFSNRPVTDHDDMIYSEWNLSFVFRSWLSICRSSQESEEPENHVWGPSSSSMRWSHHHLYVRGKKSKNQRGILLQDLISEDWEKGRSKEIQLLLDLLIQLKRRRAFQRFKNEENGQKGLLLFLFFWYSNERGDEKRKKKKVNKTQQNWASRAKRRRDQAKEVMRYLNCLTIVLVFFHKLVDPIQEKGKQEKKTSRWRDSRHWGKKWWGLFFFDNFSPGPKG